MICRRNDGFMKCDLTVLNGKRVHRWWHPFCVFTNKFCYIQNLYQMRQAEFVYVNALKTNRRGFEVCVYCNEEEDISETRLERCYKCSHLCLDEPRKFHSMCAWLHGCHFAQTMHPHYAGANGHHRITRTPTACFGSMYYKAAFKSKTIIKCEKCCPLTDEGRKIRSMRRTKYIYPNH